MKKPCKPFPPALPWGDGSGEVPGGDLGGIEGGRAGSRSAGSGAADPEVPELEANHERLAKNSLWHGRRRSTRIHYATDDPHLISGLQ